MPGTKTSTDPLAPKSDAAGAFAGPIACITLITRYPADTAQFYGAVMEMEAQDAATPLDQRQDQRKLWGLPENFKWIETVFWRPRLPEVPLLRVLASEQAGKPVRPDMIARLEGGLSVGFAMRDLDAVVAHGAELGFDTTAGIGALDMQRTDGTVYQALECHFRAPDDVYALGVGRPPDLAPVGPIEPDRSVGGPAYTGQVMNHREETMRFYTDLLGYEVRRSIPVSGPVAERGLGLPSGTTMQFLQVFAPGSTSGYFIVLDFGDGGIPNDAVAPPHSGVVMWTFPVESAAEVAARVSEVGCSLVAGPLETENPYFGPHTAVSVRTANGFLVECIERPD